MPNPHAPVCGRSPHQKNLSSCRDYLPNSKPMETAAGTVSSDEFCDSPPSAPLFTMAEPEPNMSEIATRRICSSCIGEAFLRGEIEGAGKTAGCFYCEDEGKTISIEELANRIDTAFEEHFEVTPSEPSDFEYSMIKETDFHWYREGQSSADAIAEAAEIGADAAEDIRALLADQHYDRYAAEVGEEC